MKFNIIFYSIITLLVGYGFIALVKNGEERKKEAKTINFDVMPVFQINGLKLLNMREHSNRHSYWRTFQLELDLDSYEKGKIITEVTSSARLFNQSVDFLNSNKESEAPKYVLAVKSNDKTCILTEISPDPNVLRTKFKKEFKSLVLKEDAFICEDNK